MLLLLGVLPLGVLGGIWMVRRMRAGADPQAEPAAVDTGGQATEEVQEPRQLPVAILAGALNLPCGSDAATILGVLQQMPRPALHPRLRNREGLPVFAAFVDGLDTDPAADALQRHGAGGDRALADEERLRALALLEPVAAELLDVAAALLPPLPESQERVIAGLRRTEQLDLRGRGRVRVSLLLPSGWSQPLRQACGDWLLETAHAAGLDPRRISVEVNVAREPGEVWERIERLAAPEATATDEWLLLLACNSLIGERGLQSLLASGRLRDARNAEGLVPGEGAAGLLLRPESAPGPLEPGAAVSLRGIRRFAPDSGAQPRALARATGELIVQVLTRTEVERDDVLMVLSDADQRPSCGVEAASAASAACPELDPTSQCPCVGAGSGHVGHVAPLALLALAAAQVGTEQQPVVALAVTGEHRRTAAVVAPPVASVSESSEQDAGQVPDLAA